MPLGPRGLRLTHVNWQEFNDAVAAGRIDQLNVVVPDDRYAGEGTANGIAHGSAVASKIIGSSLGLCTNAELLLVPSAKRALLEQDLLAPLVAILAEVTDFGPGYAKRVVVNLSRGYSLAAASTHPKAHLEVFCESTYLPTYPADSFICEFHGI